MCAYTCTSTRTHTYSLTPPTPQAENHWWWEMSRHSQRKKRESFGREKHLWRQVRGIRFLEIELWSSLTALFLRMKIIGKLKIWSIWSVIMPQNNCVFPHGTCGVLFQMFHAKKRPYPWPYVSVLTLVCLPHPILLYSAPASQKPQCSLLQRCFEF